MSIDYEPSPVSNVDDMAAELVRLSDALKDARLQSYTASVIGRADADVNIRGKFESKSIWDATNSRVLYASGGGVADAWVTAIGTVAITPS